MSAAAGPSSAEPRRRVPRSAFWWNCSKYVVLSFSKLYFRLRTEGRENVPPAGPVLLVANHASYLDPPMIGITTRRWVGFLAQAGLAKFAPLRWWLAQVGVTLIDRNAPSKDAMRLVSGCLLAGEAVGIFPEGTRSADGAVGPFRSGVEFLVRRTGATVVPVGIEGAFRAFPRWAWIPRPRRITVRYGETWPAERVLAPGGVETLRQRVAELAGAPLRQAGARAGGARSDGARSDGSPSGAAPGRCHDIEASPKPAVTDTPTSPSAGSGA